MMATQDQGEGEYLAPLDDEDRAEIVVAPSNPFGSNKPAVSNAAGAAASSKAIAEIQAALVIAQSNPRNQLAAMDRILLAFQRPGLAEKAMYAYARGGSSITGPSIRAAEAIAQQWGNMDFGWREIDVRPGTPNRAGESTVECFAWDLETNTRSIKTFQIKHERHTKSGTTKLTDPRDIYEMLANNASRRQRSCMLAVIPIDVVDSAMAQAAATLRATVKITPELIASLISKWAEYGVTKEALEKKLQRRIEAIMPAQVVSLGSIYNSVKDGMSVAADWFELAPVDPTPPNGKAPTEGSKTNQIAAKLAQKVAPKPEPAQTPEKDPEMMEQIADEGSGAVTPAAPPQATQAPNFKSMDDEQIAVLLKETADSKGIDNKAFAAIVRRFGKMSKAAAPSIYRALLFEGN
jgi:hypothetical protein